MAKYQAHPLVLGTRGLAGAGKSTVCDRVVERWITMKSMAGQKGTFAIRESMAGPIKKGLALMGITKEDTPDAYRYLAQTIGAYMREQDPDHWVKQFRKRIIGLPVDDNISLVMVDDVRYPNEESACERVYFLDPDFPPADLKGRESHESEAYNRARGGNPNYVENRRGNIDYAATEILEFVKTELLTNPEKYSFQ